MTQILASTGVTLSVVGLICATIQLRLGECALFLIALALFAHLL